MIRRTAWLAGAAALIYLLWLPWVPSLKHSIPEPTAIMERRVSQAGKKGLKLNQKMVWRNLSRISPSLVKAVLLAEDDVFYGHRGFDLDQIKIALKLNWRKKRYAYGGSTITQQLARTLYLSPTKSILRKAKEAVIAFWMESVLSKRRILEIYLNVVEWGPGVYGAEAASRYYYQKGAEEISEEEAVALASILPSPRRWSPLKESPFMKRRRDDLRSRLRGDKPQAQKSGDDAVGAGELAP